MQSVQQQDPRAGRDWLGLTTIAATLDPVPTQTEAERDEIIDRLQRTLEILALVEHQEESLHRRARQSDENGAMRLAVELRSLANRVQSLGGFLLDAGERVLELEDRILEELDERYRRQSERMLRPTG